MGDHNNKNELDVILKIMDTEDEELFVMCVDALKGMVTEDNREKISCSKNINKALGLIPKSGVATKDILQSFVNGWISEYPVRTADQENKRGWILRSIWLIIVFYPMGGCDERG